MKVLGIPKKKSEPVGETMIKLVYCITKKPGMTDQEFFRYWRETHGPIGRRIPGLRRLVQSHRLSHPSIGRDQDFDGMAELWFDDLTALQHARSSEQWRRSSADEKNFIDGSRTAFFVTEEHEIS